MFVRTNNAIILVVILFFTLLNDFNNAQTFKRELDWIDIEDGDGTIPNTFSGGINNLEYQFVDIDGDTDFDIIFLNSDGTFGWYENTGSAESANFVYSLEPVSGLKLFDWFYFVDIDNDSDFDLFTGNVDKVSFLENVGTTTSPEFQTVTDTLLSANGQPVFSEFGSNPLFADIDNDGDYDFFSGNASGTIIFYENTGTPQNFSLKFITNVWQDIVIIGGFTYSEHHGSSSLDFVDIDDDSDLDLFWGDFFSNSLYFIENKGTAELPDMELVSNVYPQNADSVNTSGFNMPRFTDIDNDEDFDLFVSVLFDPTAPQSLIFYQNNGTSQIPDFSKITDGYLKTLDVISNSYPTFADLDADGDLDLLIGSQNNPLGALHLLENTGTLSNPVFQYFDSSYFNISGDLSITPSLGDLDGDNDFDLLVGRFDGKIDYYKNEGTEQSADFIYEGLLSDDANNIIDVGTTAAPFLFDVDNDSDLDLTIGAFSGKFFYFRNTGTQFNFTFTEDETFYESIDVGDNSTPFLIDYDKNGTNDLFSGNRNGKLFFYRNDGTNLNPAWTFITDLFINDEFGGNTAPYLVDIDNDSDTDLLLGNIKGGIYLYNNTTVTNVENSVFALPTGFKVEAHPNPFNPNTSIELLLDEQNEVNINIYNILGEKVKTLYKGNLESGTHSFNWNGTNEQNSILPTGIYIVAVQAGNLMKSIKLAFLK